MRYYLRFIFLLTNSIGTVVDW